ncbi:MAG TPA: gamma-glutamylcyclotransferase family protein [Steroidobacter sp.]
MTSSVWGFFYGGLINPRVLEKVGMRPKRQQLATLGGFDLRISPYVNLVRSPGHMVFGLLMEVTHAELQHTYSQLKAVYLPEAVLVSDVEGRFQAALCYIVPDMSPGQAEVDHVEALATAGETLGFPQWYLTKIRSFLPSASTSPQGRS